jgi:hypothetical protein
MSADYYHADLFSEKDNTTAVGGCFVSTIAVEKLSGACEASAISRQSNQAWMRGNILNQMAMPTSSILREAARAFALTGRACSDRLRALWMIASRAGGGNCAAEKACGN